MASLETQCISVHFFSLNFKTFYEFFIQWERTACKVKANLDYFKKQNGIFKEETLFFKGLLHASHYTRADFDFYKNPGEY